MHSERGDTFAYADTDGDRVADLGIRVKRTAAFRPGDFLGLNQAPTAADDSNELFEDSVLATPSSVAGSGSDPDGDALTDAQVDPAPTGLVFNPDGNYTLDAAEYDHPSDGETAIPSIGCRTSDGHGGSATATLTITVLGTMDAPVVEALAGDTAATGPILEANSWADHVTSGTLTATDADRTDTVEVAVPEVASAGDTDALTNEQPLSVFTVAPTTLDADAGLASNLTWTFDPDTEAFEVLTKDEVLTQFYEVRATDDRGPGDGVVTIHLKGTNDAFEIAFAADADTEVTETGSGPALAATGRLSNSDN